MTSTVERSSTALNKFEKIKAEKDGLLVKNEIEHFAQIGWENMDEGDLNYRLKWLGIFFRPATPGKFMMRLRLPNGVVNSQQLRTLAEIGQRYGDDGAIDITTRQNLQLRGIRINDIPDIFQKMQAVGLTSIQSGMDNVRNITGSPVAGLDRDELFDTREIVQAVQDMITNTGEGNPEFSNLPRKFNIAIAGCRDNSVHAEINDIAFVPAFQDDKFGFNVVVGGFFSAKRCEPAIPLNAWVEPNQVVALCRAILEVYRDNGLRANRQKSRLMWLIDEWGIEKFRAEVEKQLGQVLAPAAPKDEIIWEKRDHIGVFPQKQAGLNYVGLHIPVGRLFAPDLFELSRLAEVYGDGELRLSVEQNVIIPNISDSRLDLLLTEPLLEKFSINPAPLTRALISCTGAQFCNFALIETKNRALALIKELDAELDMAKPVRFHWTGCPNSCGQPQVADIGLMGTKVRKDGKTLEGVDLFMGGQVGHDAKLGECVQKGIPCDDLKPVLRQLLIDNFGANLKPGIDLSAIPSGNLQVTVAEETKPAIPASIVLLKSEKIIDCTENDLILDAIEKVGVDLPYSCRSGTCGTCVQKIVSGKVKYDTDLPALKGLASDEILTCSASPIGQVVIDA